MARECVCVWRGCVVSPCTLLSHPKTFPRTWIRWEILDIWLLVQQINNKCPSYTVLQQAAVCHWQVGSFSSEVPEPRLGVVTGCAATGTRREMFCAEGKGGDPAGPSEQGRQQEGRAAAGSPQGCLQTPRTSSSSRIHRRKNKLIVSASCRSTSETSGDLKVWEHLL